MLRSTRDLPERRRGELNRNLDSQRLSSAIDAQRRLNAWPAEGRTKASVSPQVQPLALALPTELRTEMSRFVGATRCQ